MDVTYLTVAGLPLWSSAPPLPHGAVVIPTRTGKPVYLSESQLHRHVLLVGATGQGKTNVLYHLVTALRAMATSQDVLVIFDTKGDYVRRFWRPGDHVVGGPPPPGAEEDVWNILEEVRATDPQRRDELVAEIGHIVFDEQVRHSREPFFPKAAQNLFSAGLEIIARAQGGATTNQSLVAWWRERDRAALYAVFQESGRRALATYLDPGIEATGLGVLAFLHQAVDEVFVGPFRRPGDFSMLRAIRAKGGRAIFIEYDPAAGKTREPAYRILMDLAIKEALGREHPAGRTFFVIDEFSLLPHMYHFANGLHFGREAQISFLVGMQSHAQVTAAYEDDADAILAGFGTVIAFRVTDGRTREFIQQLAGRNYKLFHIPSSAPGVRPSDQIVEGDTVGDEDVWNLGPMSIKWTPEIKTLAGSRPIRRLRFGWRAIPQGTMDSLPIIENLDIGKDRDFRFRPCSKFRQVHQLLLEETVPGFNHGVIVTISLATHARGHAVLLKPFLVRRGGILAAAIRVMQHAGRRPAVRDRAV